MLVGGLRYAALAIVLVAAAVATALAQTSNDRVEATISVIKILDRPGRDNLATVWGGNKYIQCRRMGDPLSSLRGGRHLDAGLFATRADA